MTDNKDLDRAYVVQADGRGSEVSVTVTGRKEALSAAIEWAKQGHSNIKIVGDGRIYSPEQLAVVVINTDF